MLKSEQYLLLIIYWYGCKSFTWLDFLISLKVLPWYASFHWMTVWHALLRWWIWQWFYCWLWWWWCTLVWVFDTLWWGYRRWRWGIWQWILQWCWWGLWLWQYYNDAGDDYGDGDALWRDSCVTQLKLYTVDKLSRTIFCCISVCQASVHPTKSPLFQYVHA